jgi:hypothetical protein
MKIKKLQEIAREDMLEWAANSGDQNDPKDRKKRIKFRLQTKSRLPQERMTMIMIYKIIRADSVCGCKRRRSY